MWFNILKNEGRRAAYRFFINSLVHLGEFRPPKTPPKHTDGPYTFESSNGHLKWEVTYDSLGKMNSFTLIEMPDFVEPHKEYIQGMFENEYPEEHAALQEFFKANGPSIEEDEQEEEGEEHGLPKKVIRKVIDDFTYFKRLIAANIKESSLASQYTSAEVRTFVIQINKNIEFKYNDILDKYKQSLENKKTRRIASRLITDIGIYEKIELLLRVLTFSYGAQIRRNNPNIVWENFVNFAVFFREDYLNLIHSSVSPNTETPELSILEEVMQIKNYEIFDVIQDRWLNEGDTETLIRNLGGVI